MRVVRLLSLVSTPKRWVLPKLLLGGRGWDPRGVGTGDEDRGARRRHRLDARDGAQAVRTTGGLGRGDAARRRQRLRSGSDGRRRRVDALTPRPGHDLALVDADELVVHQREVHDDVHVGVQEHARLGQRQERGVDRTVGLHDPEGVVRSAVDVQLEAGVLAHAERERVGHRPRHELEHLVEGDDGGRLDDEATLTRQRDHVDGLAVRRDGRDRVGRGGGLVADGAAVVGDGDEVAAVEQLVGRRAAVGEEHDAQHQGEQDLVGHLVPRNPGFQPPVGHLRGFRRPVIISHI